MRIATRGSIMARAQTGEVIRQLGQANPLQKFDEVVFKTRGDVNNTTKLSKIGGKGDAFVGELREAIRRGELEAAMHSLKDMPGNEETPGLTLGAYLQRSLATDCLVLRDDRTEQDLIDSSKLSPLKIGTSSDRRRAYIAKLYPNCEVVHFRGSVIGDKPKESRLGKLDGRHMQSMDDGSSVGPVDALVLATSGLQRVNQGHRIAREYSLSEILPPVGQGIVVVECKSDDFDTLKTLSSIDHYETRQCALAERELLWVLNGHCNSPIAGLCLTNLGQLALQASVMNADTGEIISSAKSGPMSTPRELGRAVAFDLLAQGAGKIIEATRAHMGKA